METRFFHALQQWQQDPASIRRVIIEFGGLGKKDFESVCIRDCSQAKIGYPKNIDELEKIAKEWSTK